MERERGVGLARLAPRWSRPVTEPVAVQGALRVARAGRAGQAAYDMTAYKSIHFVPFDLVVALSTKMASWLHFLLFYLGCQK